SAFVPAYFMAMFVCDTITAILLFAQFSVVRSRAILIIASGYLYTGLVLMPWILTFPGVFGPQGLLGGMQSTSWLYFFQHAGLPLFVIGYALSKDTEFENRAGHGAPRGAIATCVGLTAALVAAVAILCIGGHALLPRVVLDSLHLGPLWPYAAAPVALLSFAALIVLWARRRSMLDLWLMVVMCLYTIEIPLSYYPSPVRFSVGWYTVRVIGFMSSCLVLIVLLYEIEALYARLLRAIHAERRERVARLMTGDAVAASIAHEVKQPLTAMTTSASAGFRFLDRLSPNLDRAKEAFEQIVADGHRAAAVVGSMRAMFRNDIRNRSVLDVNELIREALMLESTDLMRHKILVQAAPNDRLPAVQGDRIQLQQVLLNLITNAIDAMASTDEPRVLSVSSDAYEGDGVIVSVADTGVGVSSQDSERIFSPLFTTKSDGMGMGLSICRAIIDAHEGRLWVSPNSPQGAVFQFTLRANGPQAAGGKAL
ncbi:MAG TPA: MASE4 domain-containing protein, partial [Woeseiaceae bacterium]|nr:MASE4 domain-containing protein [Woeseiaceae bacterium]